MKKKAFTLAEVMIVLTVIGILSAILLPVAINSTPDKNILKFKKANQTFMTMMREFASSGEYFAPGNLNMKPDGSYSAQEIFCEAIVDFLPVKNFECGNATGMSFSVSYSPGTIMPADATYEDFKEALEYYCQELSVSAFNYENSVVLSDDTTIFFPFSVTNFPIGGEDYKLGCIDIDGVGKGVKPFAYGLRVDGKVLTSARVDWWLKRDITKKETDCCPKKLSEAQTYFSTATSINLCDTGDTICAE